MFRLVVTSYENKKYTKGIQTADAILKKFPNHGETQAMKGLILSVMGKRDEAMALVKDGVRNDIRSHVCWHVFGLVHKADNNFPEAIKCYLNALKIDENNQNILRDLSWLQVQVRQNCSFLSILKLSSYYLFYLCFRCETSKASWPLETRSWTPSPTFEPLGSLQLSQTSWANSTKSPLTSSRNIAH